MSAVVVVVCSVVLLVVVLVVGLSVVVVGCSVVVLLLLELLLLELELVVKHRQQSSWLFRPMSQISKQVSEPDASNWLQDQLEKVPVSKGTSQYSSVDVVSASAVVPRSRIVVSVVGSGAVDSPTVVVVIKEGVVK